MSVESFSMNTENSPLKGVSGPLGLTVVVVVLVAISQKSSEERGEKNKE